MPHNPETVDCIVIGAGVIGLAIARALALDGRQVYVLDAAKAIGTGISSRNSEVIHAGIYYEPNSLKAKLCCAGKALLYDYALQRAIPHARCGKMIVATNDAQIETLREIKSRAQASGVTDLELLSQDEALALEPELSCAAALLSPSTGIIDTHSLMLSLQGDIENAGGKIVFLTSVSSGVITEDGIEICADSGGQEQTRLIAKTVINAAGLEATAIARKIENFPAQHIPPLYYAKGNYFALNQKNPFSHLIYPVPEPGGLGVHLTIDLSNKARFGPDVEWIDEIDYAVNPARAEAFYESIRQYWPGLEDGALVPDYAGIRPKLSAPEAGAADFLIQGEEAHKIPGLVNLFGIESPGITSALAIADHVKAML